MGALHITPPAAVAVGIYFFNKIHSAAKELGGGALAAPTATSAAKGGKEVKITSQQVPKLAPQFDGLYCFETLVG
ncbi:hypothetical protein U1Q18_004920 [Sarracenia purpurea var. burkii]